MISWSDEAIEAANALLNKEWAAGIPDDLMRRALDAAVKAQGCILLDRDDEAHHARSYEKGRAEALEEAAAFVEGKGGKIPAAGGFAFLISRNNQPCMSGDPRDRLTKFDRSRFDEATAELANAIRALKEKQG